MALSVVLDEGPPRMSPAAGLSGLGTSTFLTSVFNRAARRPNWTALHHFPDRYRLRPSKPLLDMTVGCTGRMAYNAECL